jgi:hypothetical protein
MLESLQRHTQRSGRNIRLRLGQTTPDKESAIAHNPKGNDPELYTVGEQAVKYGRFRPNIEFNRSVSDAGQQSLAGRYVDAITAHHSKGLYAPETSADWLDRMKAQFPKAHTGDTYHHYAHQLAAVAAGKQPSASVDRAFLELHPVGQEFARRFDNAGVDMDAWTKGGQEQIIVGSPTDKKDSGKVGGKGLSFVKSNLPALSLMGEEPAAPKATPASMKPPVPKFKGLAEKYQASPALSEFIQAVRNVRSSNQQVRRDIAKAQYKKLKLDLKSLMDAISDGPTTASANTAHYVEHEGDYDKVRAGAALYGLQTDSPSLMLFHIDDEGPDSLVKINVTGSAERLRRKLDNAGLVNRTLIPNENGWSCLLVDKGGDSLPVIRKFAQSEGVPIEHSRGHSEVLGGGDEAEGDKGSRKSYRYRRCNLGALYQS